MNLTKEQQALEYIKCKNNFLYFLFNYVHIPEIGGSVLYSKDLLHPKFKRCIQVGLRHGKIILVATRQLGKALSLDTPIPLPNGGWTCMGNLKIGDTILGQDGLPTNVTAATDVMYGHKCYKIEFDYADPIIADAEHLWKIGYSPYKYKNKIVTTEELKRILELKSSKYGRPYIEINNAIKNPEQSLPIHPYVLGLWLGDGAKAQANIAVSEEDFEEISQNVKNCGYGITEYKGKSHTPSGYFGIYTLITELKENNLYKNNHIPRIYFSSSIDQRLELLRGLMDSDGSCDTQSGSCYFYQKNFELIRQVQELLFSLGIKNRVTERLIDNQKYYTIKFSTSKYIVFNLSRKESRQLKCIGHKKNDRHFITKITEVNSVPVRCIQVDNDNKMFLCGNFIPTHNSTIAAALIEYLLNFYPKNRAIILNFSKTSGLENIDKIKFIHEHVPDFLKSPYKSKAVDRKTYIELANGSRVNVFYPSSSTNPTTLARSLTAPILFVDEVAFIRGMSDAWASASPILFKAREQAQRNGYKTLTMLASTPNGIEGCGAFFHQMVSNAIDSDEIYDENDILIPGYEPILESPTSNGFVSVKYHWSENPKLDEAWYLKQCQDLNHDRRKINQELDLIFIGGSSCIFEDDFLSELESIKPIETIDLPHQCKLKLFKKLTKNNYYLLGVDSAKSLTIY